MEDYIVVDLEMTGLQAKTDKILEIGAVKVKNGQITDTFQSMVNPKCEITQLITNLTGITNDMIKEEREIREVFSDFLAFEEGLPLVGHNIIYDYSFLKQEAVNEKIAYEKKAVDTLKLARKFLREPEKKTLEALCDFYNIKRENCHRALDDAKATYQLYEILKDAFEKDYQKEFCPKNLIYRAKRQTPATPSQKRYLKEFTNYHRISLNVSIEAMTRSEASRLTDQLITQYGRMDLQK